MRYRAAWLTLGLCIGCLGMAAPASAQKLSRYDNRAAFAAAAGDQLSTEDFESYIDGWTGITLTSDQVSFHSTDGNEQDLAVYGASLGLSSSTLFANRNSNPLVVEFSPAVTAFAADLTTFPDAPGLVVTVEGTDGAQVLDVSLAGAPGFLGVVAETGSISRITIANRESTAAYVGIDNVAFGEAPVHTADPLQEHLQLLAQAIAEGRADGTITTAHQSLELKVWLATYALQEGYPCPAELALWSLRWEVSTQRGKTISSARAAQLIGLTDQCLMLLS